MTIPEAFQVALQHHQAGRWAEAENFYRQILAVQPQHADALHMLGVIAHQVGRNELAVELIRQAIALNPGNPAAHSNLGEAQRKLSQFDEAIASYRMALRLKPDSAEVISNLGLALRELGRTDEAIAAYRNAIQLKPDYAEAYYNLGIALRSIGHRDEAIAAYRSALRLKPDLVAAYGNLGGVLAGKGALDEAIGAYRQALRFDQGDAEIHNNLGNALLAQARHDEAIASYEQALRLPLTSTTIHSNFLASLHYCPLTTPARLFAAHGEYDARHAAPLRGAWRSHRNLADPGRRLKIGYVSPDFWHNVISHFLTPLLEAHDHGQFEIHCYASVERPDAVTDRLRKTADVWRDVLGLGDEALAEQIRADGIDILVDLSQHMGGNRLLVFARKPAPVQVAWLGHPGTTGLRAMDYRLTDGYLEPEGSPWSESVEKMARLPDSWFCFDPIETFPEPGELPALRAGCVTFGCLNNFSKVNDGVLQRWTEVLRAVEGSRLLLQCPAGGTQARVREFFAARAIAAERIELVARTATRAEFLELFQRMDIALDPFPYNGGTTTCEALWMGVPVLTLPGERIVSRIGLSILMACGMPEFVAHTEADYVQLAADLAADLPRLAELRATLRGRMKASAFMDGPRFAKNVEHAYREMWRVWCAEKTAPVS